MRPKIELGIRTDQKLVMTPAMKQALFVLQLPLEELSEFVASEIENNPLLTTNENSRKARDYYEHSVCDEPSLYETLRYQAQINLPPHELKEAEEIIGSLDERGFLTEDIDNQSLLKRIQHFEPVGVATTGPREALLTQLEEAKKEGSLAYSIIRDAYPLLLRQQKRKIALILKCSLDEVERAIKEEIRPLNPYPASNFSHRPVSTILPDIVIEETSITINDIDVSFNASSSEEIFRPYRKEGEWLMHILRQRRETLTKIGRVLFERERSFLLGHSRDLKPFSASELAKELELNPSTISRAISDKYLSCPAGTFPLSYFFSTALKGEKSARSAKEYLKQLISSEVKPLSDEALVKKMSEGGYKIARRTVAKYRKELKVPPAHQR